MTNPAVARDCARLMLAVNQQCRSLQVPEKFESKTSMEQANKWVAIVMGPMMQKVDRDIHPLVLADLQHLSDDAVRKTHTLKDICRGGAKGKHWADGRAADVDIVLHAHGSFLNITGLTLQIEKANTAATEAARKILEIHWSAVRNCVQHS